MSTGATEAGLTAAQESRRGVLCGLAAYLVWGFFPLFFKLVSHIPPLEVVAHRIVWSMLFLAVLVTVSGRWGEIRSAFRVWKTFATLCCSTVLIAANWLIFIYAIGKGEVLQSSLGYFMNPLVNVLLGFLLLRERMQRLQAVSLLLAVVGVAVSAVTLGAVPWIAILLAITFGLYGLLRKTVAVDSLVGLSMETFLAGPMALVLLVNLGLTGRGAFLAGPAADTGVLILCGVVTAVPLLFFAAAARRLRLMTMGFLQYITPSLHFLQAVWLYHEPFTAANLASFLCIWSGLALYSWSAISTARRDIVLRNVPAEAPQE
ncbi:EamA family transporter RarD [Geomonas sp. RF6]|uniref:EamA family transporter RarD n=1 Tax=Geomonas sp. RF6 TaxID=2897342 RepID=UPI001E63FAFA|nr:EamA family transporter RarD [Geomonas sp. RF6]UFS70110.1 EamA family transporter RarD [Geomonas sp. RF6]